MQQHVDIAVPLAEETRSPWRAIMRGWRRRCPNCGGGPMFSGYLTVRRCCASCGEHFHHHRADDLPAYIAIILVGKLVISLLVTVELAWAPPLWVHWVTWPTLTLALTLWLLPRIKGAVVGLQWAWRMHGFGEDDQAGQPVRRSP